MKLNLDTVAGPVLVVAPHPDDETLGCGGLIAALSRRQIVVHTVFVTEGGASHRNSPSWPRRRLAAVREQEATTALAQLGADHQPRTFMRLLDSAMPSDGTAEYKLALGQAVSLLRSIHPTHVVLPWRRDPHRDHRDSWHLFKTAMRHLRIAPEILEYAIWLEELGAPDDFPLPGEVDRYELPIGMERQLKRNAISEHKTQLGDLIVDDDSGFVLSSGTIERLMGPSETFWWSCHAQ